MKLLLFYFLLITRKFTWGHIVMERLDCQADPKYVKVDHSLKQVGGNSVLNIDAETFQDFEDVDLEVAAYSKIDGKYNEFIKPEPVSACTIKNSKDPLISLVYKEFSKFGNLTDSCPPKKGYYFAHNFHVNDAELPSNIPAGEFRIDLNATVQENGKPHKIYSLELYFANK